MFLGLGGRANDQIRLKAAKIADIEQQIAKQREAIQEIDAILRRSGGMNVSHLEAAKLKAKTKIGNLNNALGRLH